MFKHMMHECCGPDGTPDFDKMCRFMEKEDRSSIFDVIGWSLFFIWVGIAWLMGFSFGIGLIGVGLLTLGIQGVRYFMGVGVEGFWALVGLAFLIGGFWELWELALPLAPLALIAVGLGLLYWQFIRKGKAKEE